VSDVTIVIDDRAVRAMLQRAPAQINRALRGGVEDASTYLLRQMQTYPPQRSGSPYRRTGNLRRSWSRIPIRSNGVDTTGGIGSNPNVAPYNRRVQDRLQQASVHQGRWDTVQTVGERSRGQVQRFFDDRLRAELGR
jgi:hypothetical protein